LDADEDGMFDTTIPPSNTFSVEQGVPHDFVFSPGVHVVVAYGSAGYNNAFWETEVTVQPGDTVKIKMSAPTQAYLKLDL